MACKTAAERGIHLVINFFFGTVILVYFCLVSIIMNTEIVKFVSEFC